MIKSSPEYAITKPGMSHSLSRKRDKPLRTYGKRSASAPDAHDKPLSKKFRLGADDTAPGGGLSLIADRDAGLEKKAAASGHTEHANTAQPKIGADGPLHVSILSYFKPLTPARNYESSEEATRNVPPGESSRPSPNPDTVHPRSKRRLLRLRVASSPLSDTPEAAVDDKSEKQMGEEATGEDETNKSISDGEEERSPAIRDVEGRLLNQEEGNINGPRPSAGIKVRRSRRVQTTLNISTRAAFAECRVCNTVWNPLYPDDVKYHAKHHATVMRTKEKKQDEL
ncbi:zinc-finger of acetyl-transferase ESCO domain-containing protein [Hirsutella rhossiliensis]|uniref:Zinc-finger of acetyl-transferase ESCO domain-containing protein n=1 Tax=Hirsutella rhossiliensis TaxID=111463 RepID=A0A9P8MPT5_9HYPO|nr:zinc-finger of acetyl-transferase ESCO domain-containing protein [Hirsutella rhossiliensis]KAH0958289.1 zinc-finger of acetyl-transferase ESCO domain-containing protein [Hirsutella rhossiliensis]